jgi:A/G-specific adenine glycosylase
VSNTNIETSFSRKVLTWFDQHGRKNLPWQQDINPYRVWVSEIMLQQTQVKTVIPYFERFMESFPTVQDLAGAEQDAVLKHWSGLGYYARCRNMHKAAKLVCDKFSGIFPDNLEAMQSLPGIGRSTAAAILSISSNQKEAILDGNVKRVLCRFYMVEGWTGKASVLKELWEIAEKLLPDPNIKTNTITNINPRFADYTQAMMDLGATLCTRSKPRCDQCPLVEDCFAYKNGCQTDFPNKKPKKALPEKETIMLILQNQHEEVFMAKRPPAGIWGSLWCFPQFENTQLAKDWLITELSLKIENAKELPLLTHTFSHFRLHITPLIIPCETPLKVSVMEKDESLWYNITTEFEGGLAAPVQQLLNQLKEF